VKANEAQTMPAYYIPYEHDYWPLATFLVRSHGDASVLADAIRQQVAQIDNRQVVEQMETVEKYLYKRNGDSRVQAVLMSVFAGTALVLAAIGIYGLLANTMADRRREISIRMALGAAPRHVLEELLRRCALPLIVGLAVGVLNALAVTRVLETLLYGLSATDPATYGLAIGVLVTVALLAGWLPARRAMTAEPVRWLQSE
jgi:ABC-type antimicrobial peptide transport system permease subunit